MTAKGRKSMPVVERSRYDERPNETLPVGRSRARVSVLIPAKNEARNIGWVLERLPVWIDEVVLVDGRSTDRTVEVARAIRPDIVVVRDDEPGKGAAIRAGVAAASGDFVVMMDADGSMDPCEIEAFVALLYRGHDLVKGSRFIHGGGTADMSILRSAGNRALLILANVLFGVAHTDLCYGFAAFRRDRILSLELDAVGFEIETQLFLRATRQGLDVTESPSFEAPRRFGASNLNTFRDGWRVLMTIIGERIRPAGAPMAVVPIEMEPVAIPIEPGARQVASIVTDRAYALGARSAGSVETFGE
jgi:glycosyltransferase involved in cell wall biosynthesis